MVYEINQLLNDALFYKDVRRDLDIALKYAYMAAISSFSPRADVCCTIGEIYLDKNNFEWAKFWYEKAINNMNTAMDEEMVDEEYFTTIPLLKLGYIMHNLDDDESSEQYYKAVLKYQPDNEIAKNSLSVLEAKKTSSKEEETVEK